MKNKNKFKIVSIIEAMLLVSLILYMVPTFIKFNSKETTIDKKEYLDNNEETLTPESLLAMIQDLDSKSALDYYPVGSIYISVTNTNPGTIFGGTWVAFGEGKTLVGVDTTQEEFDTVEKAGGEKEHTLTIAEMPSHTHIQNPHFHWVTSRMNSNGTEAGSGFQINNRNGGSGSSNYYINSSGTNNAGYQSGQSVGALNTTATNQNTGGSETHNNLQPYITTYMWKRTA